MPLSKLPNALSLLRLALLPLLGALAFCGHGALFGLALLVSLGSDVLDGWLARRQGVSSALGAKLDSWGDLATWGSLPLFAWWLWPDRLHAELPYLVGALLAYGLPIALGFLRFGRLTSYHTWAAKGTAVVMGAALLVWLASGVAWPFHVAVWLLVAEALEELAITCALPRLRSDVPTLWHALHPTR